MKLEIFDVEQGTAEWFLCRAGVPTASCFHKVMAKGRGGEESKTRRDYLCQLADEVIYQDPVETYKNENMERGNVMEPEARSIYALENDVMPQQVGFVFNHDLGAGCSPDSFIGRDGMLQIKTSFPRLWVSNVIRDEAPPEHRAQCQGELWVCGREWLDLMIYWPKRRPFVKRILRDEPYIRELAKAVLVFNGELEAMVAALRTKYDLLGTLKEAAAQ
jgi:hypothetical protein